MAYELPPLPYPKEALEPYIDAQTMEIHHGKHHAAYVANVNKVIVGKTDLESRSVEDLISNLKKVPEDIRTAVRNNFIDHLLGSRMMPAMSAAIRTNIVDHDLCTFSSKMQGIFTTNASCGSRHDDDSVLTDSAHFFVSACLRCVLFVLCFMFYV